MVLLIAIIGVLLLGLIVFGGGQVFMPLFKSLWDLMASHGSNIHQDNIDNMFAVANSTPGVVSTKLATFTGYLVANGEWWGWLSLMATYLIFSIPSIIIVWWSVKLMKKSTESKYLKNMMIFLRPVIIGILISLSIQLFLGTAFPKIILNSSEKYIGLNTSGDKQNFFDGWRRYALISYVIFVIPESFILYRKKVNLFILISSHIVLGMVIFQPWL